MLVRQYFLYRLLFYFFGAEPRMEHLLFEHVRGYELFLLKAFEDLSCASYSEYVALTQIVSHVSSFPFSNPQDALSHILQTGESLTILQNFLEMNNVRILHCDKSLHDIVAQFGIECRLSPNITRGIRCNIRKILKIRNKDEMESQADTSNLVGSNNFVGSNNLSDTWLKQMLVSTAHVFSRHAVKYDMAREDNLVIAAGAEVELVAEELKENEKRMARMMERVFPRFQELAEGANIIEKTGWFLNEVNKENIQETKSESKLDSKRKLTLRIRNEALESIDKLDLECISQLYGFIMKKKSLLVNLVKYLEDKMIVVAPNLRCILGDRLCAKVLKQAGGLTNLSLLPSSTVQLLGSEKALFRSLKNGSETPKFGIIHELEMLKEYNGPIARCIAAKCVLAARIDLFGTDRNASYGRELAREIERKINNKGKVKMEPTRDVLARVHENIKKKKAEKEAQAIAAKSCAPKSNSRAVVQKKKYDDPTESSIRKLRKTRK